MSGYTGDLGERLAPGDGRTVTLAKPFERETLARTVRQTLDSTL